MIPDSFKQHFNFLVPLWFSCLILGPYFNFFSIPVRIDHFLYLFLDFIFIVLLVKKKIDIPLFIYPLIGFVVFSLGVTVIKSGENNLSLSVVQMVSEIEMIMRIIIIFPIVKILYEKEVKTDFFIRMIILFAFIAALLGIIQMLPQIPVLFEMANKIVLRFYVGRFGSVKSVPEWCYMKRAVSTFYHPGNFGLFCSFLLAIVTTYSFNNFRLKKFIKYGLIFVFIFSGILANAKTFLGAFIIVQLYLLIRKKWFEIFFSTISFFLGMFICKKLVVYVFSVFITMIYPGKLSDFYTNLFSSRFGKAPAFLDKVSFDFPEPITDIIKSESNEIVERRIKKIRDRESFHGSLHSTMNIIKENIFVGIGYNNHKLSNYGDSQFTNFMLRGGIVGFSFILVFIAVAFRALYLSCFRVESSLSEAALLIFIIMTAGMVAFPTYVLDRSSDVAWFLIAFSCAQERSGE